MRDDIEKAWGNSWEENYPGLDTSRMSHRAGFEAGYMALESALADEREKLRGVCEALEDISGQTMSMHICTGDMALRCREIAIEALEKLNRATK